MPRNLSRPDPVATPKWFQGYLSASDSKLHVYEGDAFRNRLVAKFETEEDAAAAVAAHNAGAVRT